MANFTEMWYKNKTLNNKRKNLRKPEAERFSGNLKEAGQIEDDQMANQKNISHLALTSIPIRSEAFTRPREPFLTDSSSKTSVSSGSVFVGPVDCKGNRIPSMGL